MDIGDGDHYQLTQNLYFIQMYTHTHLFRIPAYEERGRLHGAVKRSYLKNETWY
jgi:hypothetical protein